MTTIGRTFSPTDLSSRLIQRLGQEVEYVSEDGTVASATLTNVSDDSMATLSVDGITVAAVVPVDAIASTTAQRAK